MIQHSPAIKAAVNILALDLGTTSGWALRKDGLIHSGSITFKPGRFEGGGMRFLRFSQWLDKLIPGAIGVVYFEEVRAHKGVDAAHIYGGLMATLTAFCERTSTPYQGVPVGTIKKYATGRGNANKKEMVDAIVARGFTPADDNEADAIALLLFAEGNTIQ